MYKVCKYNKHEKKLRCFMTTETMEQAEESVREMQLQDLINFGSASRYRVYDENDTLVTAYFKLRLGQRDRDLERRIAEGNE